MRDIFITPEIRNILDYLKEHSCTEYVIENMNGNPITETVLQREFDRITETFTDEYFFRDSLRTKTIETLIRKGVDSILICKLFGLTLSELMDNFQGCVQFSGSLDLLEL